LVNELGVARTSIASVRSIYRRRETLYDRQRWSRERLRLRNFDGEEAAALQEQLGL